VGWTSGADTVGDIPGIERPGMPPELPELDPPVIRPNLRRESRRALTSPTGAGGGAARDGEGMGAGGAGGRLAGPSLEL